MEGRAGVGEGALVCCAMNMEIRDQSLKLVVSSQLSGVASLSLCGSLGRRAVCCQGWQEVPFSHSFLLPPLLSAYSSVHYFDAILKVSIEF